MVSFPSWAFNCASTGGNWSAAATWTTCNGTIPQNADNVTVTSGTVTLDTNSNNIASLTVNGTLTIGNSTTARSMTVTGATTVAGTLQVNNPAAATTHTLNLGGNLTNNGTMTLSTANGKGNVTFNGTANQTVSGNATTFNLITINNTGAAGSNVVDFQAAMTVPSPFLTITRGFYKHSNASVITPWNADPAIPANAGYWLNGGTASSGNFNVTVTGTFRISAGAMTVGTANTNLLTLGNAAAALIQVDGGSLTVTGGINSASTAAAGTFTMSAGTILLHNISAGAVESFMLGSATTFNMSGGTITARIGNNAADDINILSATQNVTGGTIQIGDASTSGGNPFLLTNTNGGAVNVWNLTLGSGIAKQIQIGTTVNVRNDLTIATGNTMQINAAGNAINVGGGNAGGSFTNNGTYNASGNTVTFTGTFATPSLGGTSATTFSGLTINKAAGNLSISAGTPSPTVTGTLTLTSGKIVTASAVCASDTPVIVDTGGTIAGGSATSYVQGALRKNFLAAAVLNFRAAGLDEFPVGTSSGYSPIEITSGATSTAGSIIACVTATDDPSMTQANGGGIDTSKSVNRYWAMTTSNITLSTLMDVTFKFNAGDVDGGANTANFIVQRWDGSTWNPTTLATAGATSTRVQNVGLKVTGTNEFEIGEALASFPPSLGTFNAFDTTTPAGSVVGNIQTKQSGTTFSVRVVRIANNAVDTTYNQAGVTVELYNSSNNSGGYAVASCRSSWAAIGGGTSVTVNFAAGVATATFTAGATMTGNSFRDVRIHVVKAGTGAGEGCSTDNFAIRPTSITVSALDATWQTAGTGRALSNIAASGGNVHAASDPLAAAPRPFTLRASPQPATATNYDGSPTVVSGFPLCCTPSTTPACAALPATCTAGALSYTAGSWTAAGSGVRENATAHYTEAGALNLQLEDAGYASVDAADGSSAATRTVPSTATAQVGRFVPDRFAFTGASTPVFQTYGAADAACQAPPSGSKRSFTYIGQTFWYATLPSATLQAVNANGNVTSNYRGALFKLAAAGIAETYSGNATGPTLVVSGIGTAALTGIGNGTGTYTAAAGGTLSYTRSVAATIPANSSPFTANISLSVAATDSSENAVAGNPGNGATPALTTGAPLSFNGGGPGIAFDGGTFTAFSPNIAGGSAFVYGRLRLAGASGSAVHAVPVTSRTDFWNGSTFALNTSDHCTVLARTAIAMGSYAKSLAPCATIVSAATVPQVAGVGKFQMTAPGAASAGSVLLTPQLSAPAAGQYCTAVGGAGNQAAATAGGLDYLRGAWNGVATYDQNPTARIAFGVYGAQPPNVIFFRENY